MLLEYGFKPTPVILNGAAKMSKYDICCLLLDYGAYCDPFTKYLQDKIKALQN